MRSIGKTKKGKFIIITGIAVLYAAVAVAASYLLFRSGHYPSGSDAMTDLYKGDLLYHSIGKGDWYPLYDRFWCNGSEPLRYGGILPAYILALCQFLAGGNNLAAYLVYIGLIFWLGAVIWLYIGVKRKRIMLGAFLGMLWFFMPVNLHVLFVDGNLPEAFAAALLPLLIHYVCEYMFDNRWQAACKIIPVYCIILVCGMDYACIVFLAVLVFLLVCRVAAGQRGRCLPLAGSFLAAFLIMGIWLYAMIRGNYQMTVGADDLKMFFQSINSSFNPFYRLSMGNVQTYLGLAACLLAVFGLLFSDKNGRACFVTGLLFLISSLSFMYVVFSNLPEGVLTCMLRYASAALCLVLFGFMLWKKLRRWILVAFCLLLVADAVPSLGLLYPGAGQMTAGDHLERLAEDELIEDARELTTQRVMVLDGSGSAGRTQYLLSGYQNQRIESACSSGAKYSTVSGNIAMLDEAVTQGYYSYLFDRCLELGNDSVLIKITQLENAEEDVPKLTRAAELLGYELVKSNTSYLLYHIDTKGTFGTTCQYNGIGIGTSAPLWALSEPDMEEGASTNLNDYSYEQLSRYKIIYLAGFTYRDRDKAEELITRLAENGVRIIISGDGMPVDEKTRNREFLGVSCQDILFENGYPLLYYNRNEIDCELFERSHREWRTVYFTGLDNTQGYLYEDGRKLDFLGTAVNDNIYFVGLNLTYHYVLTHDSYAGDILQGLSGALLREIPDRRMTELEVRYDQNKITITSQENGVNTSIAYQSDFEDASGVYAKKNLLYVNKGTAVLTMQYPYMAVGMMISAAGIVLAVLYGIWMKKRAEMTAADKTE